jgi:hypothetical protein
MENFLTDKSLYERSAQNAGQLKGDPGAYRESNAGKQETRSFAINISAGDSGQLSGKRSGCHLQYLEKDEYGRRVRAESLEELTQFIATGIDPFEVIEVLARRYEGSERLGNIATEKKQQAHQDNENNTPDSELPPLASHSDLYSSKNSETRDSETPPPQNSNLV